MHSIPPERLEKNGRKGIGRLRKISIPESIDRARRRDRGILNACDLLRKRCDH